SREVDARLEYTLGRKGGYETPSHLRPLVDVFALTARYFEMQFGRRWYENRLLGFELARAIGRVIAEFSPDADDVIPSKIVERARTHPAGEKAYLAHPGDEEARAIIMLLRTAPPPQRDLPYLQSEWDHALWKIRRDLEHLQRRRK